MTDDHTTQAMSCYGSAINKTPNMDRIANEGMRFDRCFCTNALCAPSRATILSGKYSHSNGVKTLSDRFDCRQFVFPRLLRAKGYQTAIVGKWHLGHGGESDPSGFDFWDVLEDQGDYYNSTMIHMDGTKRREEGYVTDVITDISLEWLDSRDREKPFLLMCHHKAPHRPWVPDEQHARMYEDVEIPYPENFFDDYAGKSAAAKMNANKIEWLGEADCGGSPPEDMPPDEMKRWKYQHFIKRYLSVVASVDDNIGRILDYLDDEKIADDTIVVYTSDQGFFLGEHGWFDKRFMYDEPLRMPFIVRYPRAITPGSACSKITQNIDFAPTFLDFAGIDVPDEVAGRSMKDLMVGNEVPDWRDRMYYRYYQHPDTANVLQHIGMRTEKHKIIKFFAKSGDYGIFPEPSWEMYDMEADEYEMDNLYYKEEYRELREQLKRELFALKEGVGDDETIEFTYSYHVYK